MNTIRELKQQEKYNNMLKRKNKEISILKDDKEHLGEFLKESTEEIERLQEDIGNYVNIVLHERKEIDRLKSIINEVREYIEENFYQSSWCVGGTDLPYSYIEELLEILKDSDKE